MLTVRRKKNVNRKKSWHKNKCPRSTYTVKTDKLKQIIQIVVTNHNSCFHQSKEVKTSTPENGQNNHDYGVVLTQCFS